MGAGAASMGGMEAVAKENFGTDGDRIGQPFAAQLPHKMDQQAWSDHEARGEKAKAGQDMGAAASMFKYYGTEVNKRRTGSFSMSWVRRL